MDPSFWGPSAWRLLHLIAHGGRREASSLFETLGSVLPCADCRTSMAEHLRASPPPAGGNPEAAGRWLWELHNAVNAKLRAQGKSVCSDPSFESVSAIYKERLAAGCSRVEFEGWDFLFCVASARTGTPRFWKTLGSALPFEEWRAAWGRAWRGRRGPVTVRKLWAVRKSVERSLDIVNGERYEHLCKRLMHYRAGCSGRTPTAPGQGCARPGRQTVKKRNPLLHRSQTRRTQLL